MAAEDFLLVSHAAAGTGEKTDKRPAGALRHFWWRLCLKPYGDSLCTPGAAFWIFSARVAIFIMAAAEAISWSYLGYYIGQSSQPYVTAAITGLAIFLVIWIIDASFITLDTSRSRDEATLLGRKQNGVLDKVRLAAGLLIRVAIISATLYISAPFLAQLVFFRDISAEMNRRDTALIAEKRAEVASSFDRRAAELQQLRGTLDAASIQEAAGVGASRRIGRGPTVATIEKRLADLSRDFTALATEKEAALRAFDVLPRAELQKRYGLRFAEDGIRTRAEILGSLTQNASYANAELAIRGFLAFLFLALIVLKLFQPASVSVYFSETLQDLYTQYRAGAFDAWVAREERSDGRAAMTPLRFRDWCNDSYRSIRSEDEQQRRLGRMFAARRTHEEELLRLRSQAEAECAPVRAEFEGAVAESTRLQDDLRAATSHVTHTREQLLRHEQALHSVAETIRSGVAAEAFGRAVDAHSTLERDVNATRERLRAQENERERLERQLQLHEARVAGIRARLASREAVLNGIETQLAQLTAETTAAISAAGVAAV
jgi:hypothetical protein